MAKSFSCKVVAVVVLLGIFLGGCSNKKPSFKSIDSTKLTIVTTFYPLEEFTKAIGKDKVEVVNLLPTGVEPHDWEPSARDISNIMEADLFIYNGSGFETWVPKVKKQINNKEILEVSTKINLGKNPTTAKGSFDPHIWLDPLLAAEIVKIINLRMIELDKENEVFYQANTNKYLTKLAKLHETYRERTLKFKRKDFFITHSSFGYLAKRYNLNQIPILGISPEIEPSPQELRDLINIAKQKKVQYIFFEALVSPKVAKTLADEIGAQPLVLNPIEGLTQGEVGEKANYFTLMEDNLENLATALEN